MQFFFLFLTLGSTVASNASEAIFYAYILDFQHCLIFNSSLVENGLNCHVFQLKFMYASMNAK